MFLVRPVSADDIPALEAMAGGMTPGVHTVPRNRQAIERAVERSVKSFASQPDMPGEESYFFVMENEHDELLGCASMAATAGANGIFFSFRNDVMHQTSRDLGISHSVHVLTLCSDLTGHSQLFGFYLRTATLAGAEPALLSRARLLFAAASPERFAERFFVSLSGHTDVEGKSAFWEALGRKFFQMDYLAAERLIEGARNRSLIVELMPHYPVYVPLLPGEAQAVMGQVHPEGELPLRLLSEEGFEPDEYIDLFDGGPILQAHRHALRCFSGGMRRRVTVQSDHEEHGRTVQHLVGTLRAEQFRAVLVHCPCDAATDTLPLPATVLRRLNVVEGDAVLCVPL